MPTNVTAEYKKAEQAFREAREPPERIRCLREMLRTIPKHKGTEHLQRDIKTRIRILTDELSGPRKGGARTGPTYSVRPEGAAQVALIGPPNAGKSLLHAELTGAKSEVGPYPFTTKLPLPGMAPYEDVHIQLVDLPPISSQYIDSWLTNALQPADAALLVIDMESADCIDHVNQVIAQLEDRKVILVNPESGNSSNSGDVKYDNTTIDENLFRIELPTILVANKIDLVNGPGELDALIELVDYDFPSIAISALKGTNREKVPEMVFDMLNIVRVYTKVPGKPADMGTPFTLRSGGTVFDVARQVHKDLAHTFRFARIWGSNVFDGQPVGPDHVLCDQDIIEIHVK